MGKFSLDYLTGKLAIGSLVITSIAAIIQGFVDIIPLTEWIASTRTWEVFIAIPFLILSYFTGIVVIRGSAIFFDGFRKETIEQKVSQSINISLVNNEFIANRYEQLLQDLELLQGGCPAVLLLGIAVLLDVRIAPPLAESFTYGKIVFSLMGILIVALVPLIFYLISRIRQEMLELSWQAKELKEVKNNKEEVEAQEQQVPTLSKAG